MSRYENRNDDQSFFSPPNIVFPACFGIGAYIPFQAHLYRAVALIHTSHFRSHPLRTFPESNKTREAEYSLRNVHSIRSTRGAECNLFCSMLATVRKKENKRANFIFNVFVTFSNLFVFRLPVFGRSYSSHFNAASTLPSLGSVVLINFFSTTLASAQSS